MSGTQNAANTRALVAIGNFDGVHRGHQALLAAAVDEARGAGAEPVVLTFDPHPSTVVGRAAPPLLTALDRKIELIHRGAPSVRVHVRRFDAALAASSPERFAEDVLVRELGAVRVLVGSNFRFGQGRSGDLATLERLGAALGFEARAAELVGDGAGRWSSTRARRALAAGDLDEVVAVLGRPHALTGEVVHGDHRGRTLGFPTANLGGVAEALPPFGVYAVAVDRLEGGAPRPLALGVANVGIRPTVGAGPSIEAHLFDLDADLYGARLRVHLVARLREERRFADLTALRAQIDRDAAEARARLVALEAARPQGRGWF